MNHKQRDIIDYLFGWWYPIASPRAVAEGASLREREYVRRARLTSIILLIELIDSVVTLAIQPTLEILIPLSITIFALIIGVFLNRFGKTRASGIVVLTVLEIGMCLAILSIGLAPGGLAPAASSTFLILIKPDLIALSLFPAVVALPVGLFNCIYVALILALSPKTPAMIQIMTANPFGSYFGPLSIQLVAIIIGSFWAYSSSQEMKRADRAEEVNKLSQVLASHQQAALDEKQRLEESVQQIIAIHTKVANGDLSARVPLNRNNVLWSVAGSLNNLLARLQRSQQEVQQHHQTMHAIQQTLYTIQHAKKQGTPLHLQRTGTPLDLLLAEMGGDNSFPTSPPQSSFPTSPPRSSFPSSDRRS